ncbi:hypothetical protein D3C87_447560 [compost metagenome]
MEPKDKANIEYDEWSKSVITILKNRPFLKWQTKKNIRLAKRLFKDGYTPESAAGLIILNS